MILIIIQRQLSPREVANRSFCKFFVDPVLTLLNGVKSFSSDHFLKNKFAVRVSSAICTPERLV